MSRQISAPALASANASSTDEVWLAMVRLNHPSWDEPVRLVRNTVPIDHQGETYSPFPFDVALPDEEAEQLAVVNWVALNASNELVELFRSISGPIEGRIFLVLARTPDLIEVGPLDLELRAFEYDANTLKGTMVIEPILDAVFGAMSMDNVNAPGLF